MKNPKILITLLLLIGFKSSFGQKLNKIEREYFILGSLSDYMGRETNPYSENLLDRYDELEIPLELTIDSILKKDYSVSSYYVRKDVDTTTHLYSAMIISDSLARKFNHYYDFDQYQEHPGSAVVLRKNIFTNDDERLAFLAGSYVRFGLRNDTSYEINIANSASKARVCYELLSYFKCKPFYDITIGNIPTPHMVYFHPTKQVKAYLQQFMYLRKRLEANKKKFIDMIISGKAN